MQKRVPAKSLKVSDGEAVPDGTQVLTPTRFDVGGFQFLNVGNEAILMGTQVKAGLIVGAEGAAIQSVPVVQLSMSFQTLKDLTLVLADAMAAHEKEWGPVESAFTRKRQAEKPK